MGDIVHGYLLAHSFGGRENEIYEFNKGVLSSLPETRAYLIRSMFSQVPLNFLYHIDTFQVIHFAGSYDEMYGFYEGWVAEFETLLGKLSWSQAVAFQSYTGHRVEYRARDHEVGNEAIPTASWKCTFYESYHHLEAVERSKILG